MQGMAVLTSATGEAGGGAVLMADSVRETNAEVLQEQQQEQQQQQVDQQRNSLVDTHSMPTTPPPQTYMVTVPPGVTPGMQFAVEVEGTRMSKSYFATAKRNPAATLPTCLLLSTYIGSNTQISSGHLPFQRSSGHGPENIATAQQ